jgi:two-component system, cell cycle response regulator
MHIVLVDPSPITLKCIGRLLDVRHHHQYPFTDSGDALACITHNPNVDAAIISAEQACGSGIELCWKVRVLASHYRPIYVILMSSHNKRRIIVEALDAGADDFIEKPPDADELYARLRGAERVTLMQRELARLATTDSLTSVLNRRSFFEKAGEACARAGPELPISAILIDIDHFKQVNDTFGHGVGDEVIRAVALQAAKGQPHNRPSWRRRVRHPIRSRDVLRCAKG